MLRAAPAALAAAISVALCAAACSVPTAAPQPTAASADIPAAQTPEAGSAEPARGAVTTSPSPPAASTAARPMQSAPRLSPATTAAAPALAQQTPASAVSAGPLHPAARRARLFFSGDMISHEAVTRRARANGTDELRYDYRPMFEQVRDAIAAADLAICHLETPLSADNTNLGSFPLFSAPGDLATALAEVGYDGCSTASNHSLDRGIDGIAATLETLERAGLGHAGMARTHAEAAAPVLYSVNGITLGHLSYTYGLNGLRLPPDRRWAVDVTAPDVIEAEAAAAVEAGAEFVVLSIHWGWEYSSRPSGEQRRLAAELLAGSDIDLIVGSHAHVVQPVGRVGDKYVIYGLGNFLTNQSPQTCSFCPIDTIDGVGMVAELTETPAGRVEVASLGAIPTWLDHSTHTIVDTAGELAGDLGPHRRGVLQRSWTRTARALRADGIDLLIEGDPEAPQHLSGVPDAMPRQPLARR